MRQYKDSYVPQGPDSMDEGWVLVEMEYHILRNQREALGLTQQQVADRAKIQLRQYQRLESGERSMYGASFRTAISVCKALQLDPQRFIDVVYIAPVQGEGDML